MNDALRRAIRTFVQTFLGLFLIRLVGFLNQLAEWAGCSEAGAEACAFPDITSLGYAAVAAGSAAVVAVISWLQNALEDNTNFPSLLKAQASSGQNPVTRDPQGGHSDINTIILVGILIIVAVLLFLHI